LNSMKKVGRPTKYSEEILKRAIIAKVSFDL
jgi:hypothetical protein